MGIMPYLEYILKEGDQVRHIPVTIVMVPATEIENTSNKSVLSFYRNVQKAK